MDWIFPAFKNYRRRLFRAGMIYPALETKPGPGGFYKMLFVSVSALCPENEQSMKYMDHKHAQAFQAEVLSPRLSYA